MVAIETMTDAGGKFRATYTSGAEYSYGQPIASIQETARGFEVVFGFRERNGWNNTVEFCVTGGKSYKSRKGADKAIAAHLAR